MSSFETELLDGGADVAEEYGALRVGRSSWLAAVEVAARLGLVIVGIEGFAREAGGGVRALLDFIADFSDFGPGDGPASWAAARRILGVWQGADGPDVVEFELLD